jgi:serine protease Do
MKKLLLLAAVMGFGTLNTAVFAQEEKVEIIEKKEKKEKKELKERKETQEIVIRKNGNKDTKVTVEIKGDMVTINGKPLSEFKEGDITINNRKIIMRDGTHNLTFAPEDMDIVVQGYPSYSTTTDKKYSTITDKKGAFLGVTTHTNDKDDKLTGAVIESVTEKSGAEKAGLKEGDIITGINDLKVTDPESLSKAIASLKPKDEVMVYYNHDGKNKSTKAVLGETTRSTSMSYSFSGPGGQMRSLSKPGIENSPNFNWNGNGNFNLDEMALATFPRQQKLGLKIQDTEEGDGVKVLDADKDSPADKAGLKKDDIVTEIGGTKITNTDEAREQLMENADKSAYNIKAKRNGIEMSFDIKIPKKLKTANL